AARHVLAVGPRREPIQLALPEPDLGLDLLQLEAPGLGEGEVVVGPAADALPHRLHERLLHERAVLRAGDEFPVDLGQLGGDLIDHDVRVAEQLVHIALEVRLDRFTPLERGAELLDVDVGEVGEEIEVGRVGRRVTRAPTRTTRSPSRAPQASACGAPPEPPTTAKRSRPSSSAIAAMSAAASATER